MYFKSYKFRMYPDDNQKELINKSLGCSRFVYNYFLSKIKEYSGIDNTHRYS